MPTVLQYQVERSDDSATLYVAGAIRHPEEIRVLSELCTSLPASVHTLRLDLNAVDHIAADAMEAIGIMLCEWRERRAGEFRLLFGGPDTYAGRATTAVGQRVSTRRVFRVQPFNDALAGIYL